MFGTTYLGSYMTSQSPGAHFLCGRAALHLHHAASCFWWHVHAGIQQHALLYPSSGFHDELAWAAVWLYRATGQSTFLSAASNLFSASQADGNSGCCGYGVFSWDAKSPGDSAHTRLHSTVRVEDIVSLQTQSAHCLQGWRCCWLCCSPKTVNMWQPWRSSLTGTYLARDARCRTPPVAWRTRTRCSRPHPAGHHLASACQGKAVMT